MIFGLRKFHFTRQKINFLKVKFKISAIGHKTSWSLMLSVVKFLFFSVDSNIILIRRLYNEGC
ncbi:MAG: hypothetical protein DRI37_07090 [Chloroflexi bacterium]|nr:MAG: hypothetical protein DRI37_07090 [Chloroflexota bacterium]